MTTASVSDITFLIESEFENYKTYEHIFTDRNIDNDRASQTSSFNAIQKQFECNALLEKDLRNKVNECFDKSQLAYSFKSLDNAWFVDYQKGGYQTLHNHLRKDLESYKKQLKEEKVGIASAIINFNTIRNSTKNADEEGCFYGLLDNSYVTRTSNAGGFFLMDCSFWHGVYPTPTQRRVLVFDLFYNIN